MLLRSFSLVIMDDIEHAIYMIRLEEWTRGFEDLVAWKTRNTPLCAADRRTVALLNLHRQDIEINMMNYLPGAVGRDAMKTDKFTSQYSAMVDNAAIVVGLDSDDIPSPQPQFHMDFGIAAVMISVIGKCRDPLVRRKAILLLLAVPVQEGMWSSVLSARCGHSVVKMEEEMSGRVVRSCEDVPFEARLQRLTVDTGPGDREATMTYTFPYGERVEALIWD